MRFNHSYQRFIRSYVRFTRSYVPFNRSYQRFIRFYARFIHSCLRLTRFYVRFSRSYGSFDGRLAACGRCCCVSRPGEGRNDNRRYRSFSRRWISIRAERPLQPILLDCSP